MDGMKMGRRKEEEGGKDGESGRGRGMLGGRERMKKGEGRDGRTPQDFETWMRLRCSCL